MMDNGLSLLELSDLPIGHGKRGKRPVLEKKDEPHSDAEVPRMSCAFLVVPQISLSALSPL